MPGEAKLTDPDLVNPWGLALLPTTPLWSANAGSDTSTLYSLPSGSTGVAKVPTVRVTMPNRPALPTGQVANPGSGFALGSGAARGPAQFIFATITGRIEAWSPKADPLLGDAETKATVPGASYTGLALAGTRHGDELFAADFGRGRIDVFDSSFKPVKTSPSQFRDPRLPAGYAPFNAQTLNGNVYVTYDKPDRKTGREVTGKGIGLVDEYTPDGRFVGRVLTGGDLNAPWGLAIAPASWGPAAGSLLVGNFGDGRINVVAKHNGRFDNRIQSQVRESTGKVFSVPGLWALLPGTATTGGTDVVWFSAGIDGEQHGLLGVLRSH